jgi:hypothetical protein
MEFHAEARSLGLLSAILNDFAVREGFEVQDVGKIMPHFYISQPFFLNLHRADNAQIIATNIGRKADMFLSINDPPLPAAPVKGTEALLSRIRNAWPDLHIYSGP